MRVPGRIGDGLVAGIFMSLAWSLRGQFGHLKGALIPGAVAAAIVCFFHQEELWRKGFGWAVILSALGFSLGGHLSYGALIERILASPDFATASGDFFWIFIIGAVWGGLGLTFLGFALSEKPFTPYDLLLLAFLGVFWFIPLGVFNQEAYDLLLFGAGLAVVHAYNFFVKKSQMMSLFGAAGILGFGFGFLAAVVILYTGHQGWIPGSWRWWALRDQILGFIAGWAIVIAFHRSVNLGLSPAREMITLTSQKAGLIFYVVFIPLINCFGAVLYWMTEQPLHSSFLTAFLGFLFLAFFGVVFVLLARAETRLLVERALDHLLFFSTLIFIWVLSASAIAKQLLPFGWSRWEPAFTLFLMDSFLLTLFLPFKIYRRNISL